MGREHQQHVLRYEKDNGSKHHHGLQDLIIFGISDLL